MVQKVNINQLSDLDRKCFDIAIIEAQKCYNLGSYPVGAVLLLNDKEIYSIGNTAKTRSSLFYHAENSLIEKYGEKMYECFKNKQSIKLYSTLEPCLMCLGTSVLNKVNEIIFIQFDPHAGACNLEFDKIGLRYTETMPSIKQVNYSKVPYELLLNFFEHEISIGNDWGKKMRDLFEKTKVE